MGGTTMRIGFDVDGVLADFNRSFIERVVTVIGRDLFPPRPFDIPCWDYPEHYGYTSEETTAVWKDVVADPTFWSRLQPYDEATSVLERLRVLSLDHDLYFVTSRPGIQAKQQTETWLAVHSGDFLWNPTVLISGDKDRCARALKLEAYIDDRWENCVNVASQPSETTVYLLDRPWNQDRHSSYVHRTKSADAFLDDLFNTQQQAA
jgi:5'(3')-deoxyribonucleotidase